MPLDHTQGRHHFPVYMNIQQGREFSFKKGMKVDVPEFFNISDSVTLSADRLGHFTKIDRGDGIVDLFFSCQPMGEFYHAVGTVIQWNMISVTSAEDS